MRILTHWISPRQASGDIFETIQRVKNATPAGWQPRALVPCVYGDIWQASDELSNDLHMDLRPKDAVDLGWIKQHFEDADVLCGGWGVPRSLSYEEGVQHGKAASAVDLYVLDVEPYGGFLEVNDRGIEHFVLGFHENCKHNPGVSIVPQPSGLDPLGNQWAVWYRWASSIRPQCYFTDGPYLGYPTPSMRFLENRVDETGLLYWKPIIPILPNQQRGGAVTRAHLAMSEEDLDLWVLE